MGIQGIRGYTGTWVYRVYRLYMGIQDVRGYTGYVWVYMGIMGIQWVYRVYRLYMGIQGIHKYTGYT